MILSRSQDPIGQEPKSVENLRMPFIDYSQDTKNELHLEYSALPYEEQLQHEHREIIYHQIADKHSDICLP